MLMGNGRSLWPLCGTGSVSGNLTLENWSMIMVMLFYIFDISFDRFRGLISILYKTILLLTMKQRSVYSQRYVMTPAVQ